MKNQNGFLKIGMIIMAFLLILIALGTTTYAWFSSNRMVDTTRVTGRSNNDEISLLVDDHGGNQFQGKETCNMIQLNKAASEGLLPVSTSDLRFFVSEAGSVEANAVSFQLAEEKYYFHGRIYVKAEAVNPPANSRMAVYLDEFTENGGAFLQNPQGGNDQAYGVENAARLGILLENGTSHILQIGEGQNPGRTNNTVVGGQHLEDGYVLHYNNGQVQAVRDSSDNYRKYLVNEQGLPGTNSPLFYLNWNQVTTVDVFFYLEGCDPDCVDIVSLDQFDFHLGLYGVMDKEANE